MGFDYQDLPDVSGGGPHVIPMRAVFQSGA